MNLRHVRLGVLTAALFALLAVAAPAQTDAPDQFSFAFTTAKAKAPAGYSVEGEFPRRRIIDQIAISFPAGTKFDTAAVTRCTASEEEVSNNPDGVAGACPAESKIGTGKGTAYLGDNPDPVVFDLGLYNRKGGAILDIMLNGKTAFSAGPTITGRKMTIPLSLTPSLNARITAFELSVPKAGTKRKPYLRTPATCPAAKKLTASLTARENGAGSETTKDTTVCKRS
ncbi:MAG TPA: hypothetical protein VF549_16005 [Solirubrobacteraceae bacterium]|jgi:hypothetical protein